MKLVAGQPHWSRKEVAAVVVPLEQRLEKEAAANAEMVVRQAGLMGELARVGAGAAGLRWWQVWRVRRFLGELAKLRGYASQSANSE